jgi:hypothetical protein
LNAIVCTLFEGHYHYGLATLINSLYYKGYKGKVFAGYKGALPYWASDAKECKDKHWPGYFILNITTDLEVHFLLVETNWHLTNYKPEFMLLLWETVAKDAEAIAYFDPDIVVKCHWSFFERWMKQGVALVHEIISNDMPPSHPIRLEWKKVIEYCNLNTKRNPHSYINGGFCGVSKGNIEFLHIWKEIMTTATKSFGLQPDKFMPTDRTHIFFASDQDALNVAAMCSESPISEMGPEAMDFIHGGWTMSHAVGAPKPWKKKFLYSLLKGVPPSLADREFWMNVDGPIRLYQPIAVKSKRLSISIGNFVSRFYRR